MNLYDIAGIKVAVNFNTNLEYIQKRMSPFLSKYPINKDITIEPIGMCKIENPLGKILLSEEESINWVAKNDNKGFYGFMTRIANDEIISMIDTDEKWENTSVYYTNLIKFINMEISPVELMTFQLMGALFRNRILLEDGIVMHGSSIKWGEKGIIFSAPSGTGKSTHVRLWEKYNGDEVNVLNDDTPAIRMFNGSPFVFGTPWSGSSDKFTNMHAPLTAIVILEQAPENHIQKLSIEDALTKIIPRCFLPYFDQNLMDIAMRNVENIISKTQFYLLKCRPDKEAMELVLKCV